MMYRYTYIYNLNITDDPVHINFRCTPVSQRQTLNTYMDHPTTHKQSLTSPPLIIKSYNLGL